MAMVQAEIQPAPSAGSEATFALMPPPSRAFHGVRVLVCLFVLGVWLYWTVGAVVLLIEFHDHWFAFIFAAGFWCAVSAFCFWYLRPLLRRVRWESIKLDKNEFRYDSGNVGPALRRFGLLMFLFAPWSWRGPSRERIVSIDKKIVRLKLTDDVWRSQGRQLFLDCDGREVEIGALLTDEERCWLFKVITEWKNQDS